MKNLLNGSLFAGLINFANKVEQLESLNTLENLLRRHTNCLKYEKSINVASFYEVGYVGEFLERCEERGLNMNETNITTLALFYAIAKDEFKAEHINEYQIRLWEKFMLEKAKEYENNSILNYAMYLVTKEDEYLNKVYEERDIETIVHLISISLVPKLNKEQLFFEQQDFMSKFYPFLTKKDNLTEENIEYFVKLIGIYKRYECWEKEPIYDLWVKSIDSKITGKKNLEMLYNMGFKDSDILIMSYYLKRAYCEGELKIQKYAINLLDLLTKEMTPWGNFEKAVIVHIFNNVWFKIKMESGIVTNWHTAIDYYGFIENLKCIENYEFFMQTSIERDFLNAGDVFVDFYKDSMFIEKSNILAKIFANYSSESNYLYERECSFWLYELICKNICKLKDNGKEALLDLKQLVKDSFDVELIDIFSIGPTRWNASNKKLCFRTLCDSEIFNVVDLYNSDINKGLLVEYLKDCKNRNKWLCVKTIYEGDNPLEVLEIFDKELFIRKMTFYEANKLAIENCSDSELKEMIEIISECAAIKSPIFFKNFFFNFLLNNKDLVERIYNEDEIEAIYNVALEFSNSLSKKSVYYDFDKETVVSTIKRYYMSQKEKDRIEMETKMREEEEKRERQKQNEEDATDWLNTYVKENDDIFNRYSAFGVASRISGIVSSLYSNTEVVKQYLISMIKKAEVYENEVGEYLIFVGKLVNKKTLTFTTAQECISNLKIIKKDEDVTQEVA